MDKLKSIAEKKGLNLEFIVDKLTASCCNDETIKHKYLCLLVDNNENIEKIIGESDEPLKKIEFFFKNNNLLKQNDICCDLLGYLNPKYNFKSETGILGEYNHQKILDIASNIKKDGYYVYDSILPEDICDKICDSCSDLKFYLKSNRHKTVKGIDLNRQQSSTYWIGDQFDLARNSIIQDLYMDPTILGICQEYLNTIPINTQTNLWYSISGKSDGTQNFHQDYDDLKFIKVFIYLSDVGKKNGPHSYVKGSRYNIKCPKRYKIHGRVQDSFIDKNYNNEDIIKFTGKKGTIIFEDTTGFHKGSQLEEGHRIMLQLQYSSTTANIKKREKIDLKNDKFPICFLKYK